MRKQLLSLLLCAAVFTACTETIDKKISSETFVDDFKEIKTVHASAYDSADFAVVGFAVGMGKVFGAEKTMGEKTYRQLLDEAKADREKKEREFAAKLAQYQKDSTEWAVYQNKLNGTISFEILEKGFETDRYGIQKQQVFRYSLKNASGKEIKAVKGGFYVYDTFGEVIGRYGIENEKPLADNQGVKDVIYYDFNSYSHDDNKVKESALKDLKYEWKTMMVIFADGSVMEPKPEPQKPSMY